MASIENDIQDMLNEFASLCSNFETLKKNNVEMKETIKLLEGRLRVCQEAEEGLQTKVDEKQETISKLQEILLGYMETRDENEVLLIEIKELKDKLEEEKKNYSLEKEKWLDEKDKLVQTKREEIENIKKIRDMEVASLNREINNMKGESERKIELMRNEVEQEAKHQLTQTIMSYEEKLQQLSRELISAQSQLKNLRQTTSIDTSTLETPREVVEARGPADRYIPQPLSFSRYRPVVPIVSTASQMMNTNELNNDNYSLLKSPRNNTPLNATDNMTFTQKKKRKLYSRNDEAL